MASAKLVLDKRAAKKDGTFPVKIYVNHRGEFYLPTGIDLKLESWIGDAEVPTENKRTNSFLMQMLTRTRSMIYQLRADGKLEKMSKDDLKILLSGKTPIDILFLARRPFTTIFARHFKSKPP